MAATREKEKEKEKEREKEKEKGRNKKIEVPRRKFPGKKPSIFARWPRLDDYFTEVKELESFADLSEVQDEVGRVESRKCLFGSSEKWSRWVSAETKMARQQAKSKVAWPTSVRINVLRKKLVQDASVWEKVSTLVQVLETLRLRQEPSEVAAPYIWTFYSVLETEKEVCFIYEAPQGYYELKHLMDFPLVDGEKLHFDEAGVRLIAKQLLETLQVFQECNIAHRTLNLYNILYAPGLRRIMIVDFLHPTNEAVVQTPVGRESIDTFSPEILRGTKYHAHKADIWACGAVIHQLYSREFNQLFPGGDRSEAPALSKSIDSTDMRSFLLDCLQPDASKRPSAAALLKHPWLTFEAPRIRRQTGFARGPLQQILSGDNSCNSIDEALLEATHKTRIQDDVLSAEFLVSWMVDVCGINPNEAKPIADSLLTEKLNTRWDLIHLHPSFLSSLKIPLAYANRILFHAESLADYHL